MAGRRVLAAATVAVVLAVATIAALSSGSTASGSPTTRTSPATGTSRAAASLSAVAPVVSKSSGSVIVIGTGGLSWSDVSAKATPALWSLLHEGATAALTVHSVRANTCPVDGWLTLSAGQQAGDVDGTQGAGTPPGTNSARPPCRALPGRMTAGKVPHWDEYRSAAAAARFDAKIGLLGDQVASHGRCVQAVGPGAALGAARANGIVDLYQEYQESTLTEALARCQATLIDVGSLRDRADLNPGDEVRPTTARAQQVAAIDARVAAVLKAAPAGSNVLLASLSDAGATARLRLVAAHGPGFGTGTLESGSTRTPGLVQLADLTPTILQQLDIPAPTSLGGAPLRSVSAATNSAESADERRATLLDYDEASYKVRDLVKPFFATWLLLQLGLYLTAAVLWRRGRGQTVTARQQLLGAARRVAIVSATVPVSTFLANLLPWWRFSVPFVSLVASVALFAAAVSLVALLGPWRRWLFGPPVVVCAATMLVLAIDVMTSSRLQISSLMGLQPLVGGRFYGMGNVTFALFATATLLLATAVGNHLVVVGQPRLAAGAVAAIGLVAVVVDASPSWGSDLGGPPALVPGLIFLILTILQIKLTWLRLLAMGGGIFAFLVLLSLMDWLRPAESRSHLGKFIQTTIDGGAWEVIVRKLDQNITLFLSNPLSLVVPLALVLFAYLLARPTSQAASPLRQSFENAPLLRPGLIAVLVMWVIGFALNDSGSAIPAVGGTLALPLVIAIAIRTKENERLPGPAPTRAARRRR